MGSVIVSAVRTPVGKFGSTLGSHSAVDLGATAISAALQRAQVAPEVVDYVIMGHVLQAGTGQITARQAAIAAGVPKEVPALTVNKVCLSSLTAVALADQLIRAGEIEVAVAGGMESMSNAPYLIPRARWGARMGNSEIVDAMVHDGLWSTFSGQTMGQSSDEVNDELGVSRTDQDRWAARSHRRAAAAWERGRFADEVVGVEVTDRRGKTSVVERDEGIRGDATPDSLGRLAPSFSAEGTITVGNASQISDGGAALVVMSEARAQELNLEPLAEIVAYGMSADRYPSLHTVPALALERALKKSGLAASDLGLIEINEAFAAVPIHASRMLGADEDIVNVNGGAVALGHPIGASGARIVLTLIMEMRRRGIDLGGSAICGGGGQGDALVIRRI